MTIAPTVYPVAFVVAIATSMVTFPFWKRFCRLAGLVDDPGHRKIHEHQVPLAGGLTVMTALVVPLLAGWLWLAISGSGQAPEPSSSNPQFSTSFLLKYGFGRRTLELAGILVGALGILIVGCLDDRFELRPLPKFGGQFGVALLVALCGVRITLFVPSLLFSYAITVFWILTVINAFNFMDNMNGLCTGLGVIAAAIFASIAALQGQYLVALMALTICGALTGFLPFNFPNAQAFLGDGGSHLVGYLLAILAILPHFYTPETGNSLRVLTPLFVLAVPLLDLVWVVILRWRKGQPFYVGDTNHLSHRLVRFGFSRTNAVLAIWIVAALSGSLPLIFW